MAKFQVILPAAMSCDATSPDQMFRSMTVLFGLQTTYGAPGDPSSGLLSDLVVRRGRQPGAICARSGNYFPGEQLTVDGQGRIVGKRFRTGGPVMPVTPPWPAFGR